MEFRDPSDGGWEIIKPLLPPKARVGRPGIDDRRIINGVLHVLATGCRWMNTPAGMGITQRLLGGLRSGRS